ncbi:MAG: tRNA (N(6)-L-threonylcarbamoyladenosine(37)-C(2))-methylthiotransferase MtaB [Clostridia bacterium]|nr:tRNA (N(6)-L-threonylcarbamoyladenosine(37)-C(2))-methylthiotransferase MtaB [Clostridia bacterium]
MKICIFTLGCKVNESESGSIAQGLIDAGYDAYCGLGKADLYILNTCAVTKEAEKKSRQAIARMRKYNADARILVMGCAAEKAPADFLAKEGVLFVTGAQKKSLALTAAKQLASGNFGKEKQNQTQASLIFDDLPVSRAFRTRADIKIQDGCNNFCSYCIVPYLRGRERSRDMQSIRAEIQTLAPLEAVLTGINISSYKTEQGDLGDLLVYLSDLPTRLRLGSIEVRIITPSFLQKLQSVSNFAPHFHLSLQSGSTKVLKEMNRRYSAEEYLQKVALIRQYFPNAAITTDVIAGFPTETEEDFNASLATCRQAAFADMHCFPFSPREGTVAYSLKDLPHAVKKERTDRLLLLAKELKEQYANRFIGTTLQWIAEEQKDGYTYGYTENYLRVCVKGDIPRGKYQILCQTLIENEIIATLCE